MSEQKELTITISKNPAYDKHKLKTSGMSIDESIRFNKGEKVKVALETLYLWGYPQIPRWVIVHADDVDIDFSEEIEGEGEIK